MRESSTSESVPARGLLARPNRLIGAALLLLSALAWVQLFGSGPNAVSGLPQAHAVLAHVHGPARIWSSRELGLAFSMWLLMAVAMMLPTAAPAIASFADIVRAGQPGMSVATRVGAFVLGYLLAWWGFGALATGAQWGLADAALHVAALSTARPWLAGLILTSAGLYQFSALKDLCLRQCRSPMTFFLAHWRAGAGGATYLGWRHGVHCVGCCWALMALTLLGGAMSFGWTAALMVVMLIEKIAPAGRIVGHILGVALIVCGSVLIASALFPGELP